MIKKYIFLINYVRFQINLLLGVLLMDKGLGMRRKGRVR